MEDELVNEYIEWCEKHKMEQLSADELLYELLVIENRTPKLEYQIAYLEGFIERWEKNID